MTHTRRRQTMTWALDSEARVCRLRVCRLPSLFLTPLARASDSPMLTASTLPELLRTAARQAPAAEAFRYRSERLTYREWDALADQMAGALAARGIRHGDVVALLLPSTPFYH